MNFSKLSKPAVLLFFAISSAHGAFVPYPRQLNNVTIAPTAIGSAFISSGGILSSSLSPVSSGTDTVTSGASSSAVSSSSSSGLSSSAAPNSAPSNSLPSNSASSTPSPSQTTPSISAPSSSAGPPTTASLSSTSNSNSINSNTAPTTSLIPTGSDSSLSTGTFGITSPSSGSTDATSGVLSPTSSGATIVPFTIKATDGSGRSTAVTWSAVETGSTSTTDNSGHPTIIPAPFWTCGDPLCVGTGCVLAILCSIGGGGTIPGFDGFPPPEPPSGPPPDSEGDSPSGSVSPSPSITGSSLSSIDSITSSVSTTSSSASSSTSSGECAPITTVVDPGPTAAGDPDDGSRRRLRLRHHNLIAREAPIVSTIGACTLTSAVKIPLFLSFGKAMNLKNQPNNGANGLIYNAIEKWYAENLAINGDPFLGVKIDNAFNTITGPGSTDHVWEKSNLADFLSSLFGSDFDCDDLNALFSCGVSLQKIFNQLPSMDPQNVQTGFAFMNRNLNGMKGWMFSQGFTQSRFNSIYNSDDKVIQGLERQAIIFNIFNTDGGIQSMHDQANNRVYSIFLALDNYISANNVQRAKGRGDLTQTFGPTFKTWYEQLLTNTGTGSYNWASGQITRLNADPSLPECLRRAINAFQSSPLYGQDKFQIDQSHLSWTASPIVLKRDLLFERDGACTLPTNSASTSSPPSTSSPTPVSSPTSTSSTAPALPSNSGSSPPAPNESIVCQDPGQASFHLTDATNQFDEYCAHFDGQIYPAITNQVSALREFYDNHAGVWVELWSNIAADDNCKQGEVKFSRGDCLTALGDAANKCKNDDGTSTGGNAEPFNCANFGFIGNTNAPSPDATAAAATTSQPIPTGSVVPDPSESAASASQSAADASWSAAAATPSAGCWITDDDGFGDSAFEVYGINGWAGDDGAKLLDQEKGCGVLVDWQWHTGIPADFQGRSRDTQTTFFSLSLFKGGCVERAVHSAGGPPPGDGAGQLACQHGGPSKRRAIRRALNTTLVERNEGVVTGLDDEF